MLRAKLQEAEVEDHYREACASSPANAAARQGDRYEPAAVRPTVANRMDRLSKSIPLLSGAAIGILHSSADSGFPHTRPGGLVCMPAVFCENRSEGELRTTLIHESLHLHQRKSKEVWDSFCRAEGWSSVPDTEIPETLQANCRINPDTMMSPFWAWQQHYVPLPLLVPKPQARLSDTVVKWFDLRNGVAYQDPPPSFLVKYGSQQSQPEHPYEIYAVLFADEGIKDEVSLLRRLGR